jgi:gamma-glutamylcyclotransferase (GGCT)/AIG2-like uncharacterized protein YtfP
MVLEYIFVYGLFRDSGNGLLDHAIFCDKAYVYGHIYDVNEFYPGFVFDSCNNKVWGDVYLMDPSIFPSLDEFEGDEYIRTKIYTSIGEECWIYVYQYDVTDIKEIAGGDWMLRGRE